MNLRKIFDTTEVPARTVAAEVQTPVSEVKLVARPAKGVKVMRILDDDRLITLSTTAKEEEQEEAEAPEGEAPAEATEGSAEVAEEPVKTVEAEPVEE